MAFSDSPALSFGQTWDAVLETLRVEAGDASTTLHALGLTREAVVAGELGRAMPMAAPFVYVFLIPTGSDGVRAGDGVPYAPAAALRVFCGVKPEATTHGAIVAAMELGAAVLNTLRRGLADAGVLARYEASPLRLDSYTSKLAVCDVAGAVYYSLAVAPPSVAYLVRDTFTDADGTALDAHTPDVGGAWTIHNGAWAIAGGVANEVNGAADARATVEVDAADVLVECVLDGHDLGNAALLLRRYGPDAEFGVRAVFDGVLSTWQLIVDVELFGETVVGSSDVLDGAGSQVQVYAVGTSVALYVDGVLVAQADDVAAAPEGSGTLRYGIGTHKNDEVTFDDFTVEACAALH